MFFLFVRESGNPHFRRILPHGNGNLREIDTSTGIVWMETGNQGFREKELDGTRKSICLGELFGWDDGNDICTEILA